MSGTQIDIEATLERIAKLLYVQSEEDLEAEENARRALLWADIAEDMQAREDAIDDEREARWESQW